MSLFARVVPELSLDRAFDYAIPEQWRDQVCLGSKVRITLGGQTTNGYVVELLTESSFPKIKPILEVAGDGPFLPEPLIQLAKWMADYYCAPLAHCFKSLLPEAVRRTDARAQERLWVESRPSAGAEEIAAIKGAKRQKEAWQYLQEHGPGWMSELCAATATTAAVWRGLEDKGLVLIGAMTRERDPFEGEDVISSEDLILNDEQAEALKVINSERADKKPKVILLHGVTGSGKTEVYLQAISEVLQTGKNALVLVPEIALTPQAIERFRSRFAGRKLRVAVLHSHLSGGERHDQWHQISAGRARIVIGARSAVFAPVQNLGLIVVDEEHEMTYKQEDTPHYHARDVAVMRGHIERVPVVLGSATPSMESYHHATQGKYRLCVLKKRVESQSMPTVHVVDVRQEFKKTKKSPILTERLREAVRSRLEKGEQSIIFLNRRGYATSLQCPQCGHVETCPNCSVSLTFHRQAGRLRCHFCGHGCAVPKECPECHFQDYKYSGAGTEKIEEAVTSAFPDARIARMDSDTMRGKNAHRDTLRDFGAGKIDILVGTQMIAKGLHFPNVTCVGVVHADLALQMPDFRASERVFQILMQVSGRAGRGDRAGEVFVQTHTPFHPAIQFARHHDYEGFVDQELEFRRGLDYPPLKRAILITWKCRDENKVAYVAEQTAKKITGLIAKDVQISGPAPAPLAKLDNLYRYHLFLRTARPAEVSKVLRPIFLDASWPDGVRATVDVDPMYVL